MQDLIGRTLGHYRIVEKIGEGGMGEVYRARDERLDRDVAIKVLPEEVAGDPHRLARFEREAKAVAKLNHPNILDVYELGDHEGRPFMATELLEGETLRERLSGTFLGWRKTTEIGAAIADGLGAAHEAGICHRDLKPSNVFITADGRVKVLDFGLARYEDAGAGRDLTHAPTITRQTDPGTVLGTVGYMSPEQVRAETVDQRSDIFSLGCVLYEMVSGQRAFTGDSAVETMNAILKEEPTDVSASGAELPPELAGTIRRCLEKRPQARFQSASDLAYNLRTISSASVPSGAREAPRVRDRRRSAVWFALAAAGVIAVAAGVAVWAPWRGAPEPTLEVLPNRVAIVPLENRTGDPSLDTLGILAADLIVQRIAETSAAEVVLLAEAVEDVPPTALEGGQTRGRTHVLRLARERGAGLVLSGAYYLDGESLRLQARLVDAATGDLIYAFEPVAVARGAAAEGIEMLRERVLAAVAAHDNPDIDIAVMRPPASYEAFQSFQQGQELYGSNFLKAIAHFRRALEIDPEFHVARDYLIWAYFETGDRARAIQEISVADGLLNRMTPYDQARLRYARADINGDRAGVANALRRMLEFAPHNVDIQFDLGWATIELNRPGEAAELLEPIVSSWAPTRFSKAWWALWKMTEALHMLGDYEREFEYAELGLERFPDVGNFYLAKARALAAMGLAAEATEVIDACLPVRLREGEYNQGLGYVMTATACELRTHGYRSASDDMAARAVAWLDKKVSESDTEERDPEDLSSQSYALCVAGRWDEAREPLEELRKRGWNPVIVAGALGVIAANTGDQEEALRIFDELHGDPGDPRSASNRSARRAAIAAQLGEKDRAVDLLAEAFSQGKEYSYYTHINIGLEPLWDYPPFQELIEPKG
jgi:tetratricopeptide (TPR) repeat protein